jgi:hypothetical protein
MPTGYGTIYNDGVKYLKINKFDANGTDKSDYLAQMTSIRINHGDVGTLQYNIATTQVQNDYFIFGLTYPQPTTSSIGDINDYKLIATQSSFNFPLSTLVPLTASLTASTNPLGYFNNLTSTYTLDNTPNIPLSFSLSATSSNNLTSTFIIIQTNRNIIGSALVSAPPSNPDYIYSIASLTISPSVLSGSSTTIVDGLLETDTFITTVSTGLGAAATVTNITWNITQSSVFNGSSSLVIFDPDQINFDYNDYNPLLDNAETPQYSNVWMDVDYSQNPVTPVNFGLIISGTADKAYVQDSNYSSRAWSGIRYNGSRTTSYVNNV